MRKILKIASCLVKVVSKEHSIESIQTLHLGLALQAVGGIRHGKDIYTFVCLFV